MNLSSQRKIAARALKVGVNRVKLDPEKMSDVAEALTREDIKGLVKRGVIKVKPKKGVSRSRARKNEIQRGKGRGGGHGSRHGSKKARMPKKKAWAKKVRAIRDELRKMKIEKKIDETIYRKLYRRAKGNLFHSRRHLREYISRMRK